MSGADMVRGPTDVDPSTDGAAAKALVLEYTKQVLQQGDHEKLGAFVTDSLLQHAPQIAHGRAGLASWLTSEEAGRYEMMFQLIGQGDFVVTYGKRHAGGRDIAAFDLYRVANGLIVEHWMNEEEIGPRETWGNSGKF
ncbi:MAG: nuclear transport factor 2 family protein [Bacteroidota bacterium]